MKPRRLPWENSCPNRALSWKITCMCQQQQYGISNGFTVNVDHVLCVCVCIYIYIYIYIFIHVLVCLTTGPKPLPKRAPHIVRSRASSFKWEYPLLSLRLYNSFLRLLPCLPVTSIPTCIFPSITRCRRQFLRKMWPIVYVFHVGYSSAPWL